MQRRQRAPHDDDDQQRQDQREHQQRCAGAHGHLPGQLVAHGLRLRHLHVAAAPRFAVQAPVLAVQHDIGKAGQRIARQCRLALQDGQGLAVLVPRLQHERFFRVLRGGQARLRLELVGQGHGQLAQLQVGQFIGFFQQRTEQGNAGAEHAQQGGGQQAEQQLAADGQHAATRIL
ncbi:hypothetical protein D3C81_1615140 [compost metagenome]